MNREICELAGKTVKIASGTYKGQEYRVEGWWDKLTGKSWGDSSVIAAFNYARRTLTDKLPSIDDEGEDDVLYGKIGTLGYLIHINEVEQPD